MCLIIFNWQPASPRPLTLAANRDEFHSRPSLDAHYWEDKPTIFAGRDLKKNGTWLGLSKNTTTDTFRLSVLTNFRSVDKQQYEHSRGEITQNFLDSNMSAIEYVQQVPFHLYAGFNGIFYDATNLVYCHHEVGQAPEIIKLKKGVYGLSNAKLDTPWPKVESTKRAFETLAADESPYKSAAHLLSFLRNSDQADDNFLPTTGVGVQLERLLSSAFIISPSYGTRTASAVIIDEKQERQSAYFLERQFSPSGENIRELVTTLN